jgi:hypothetical protein
MLNLKVVGRRHEPVQLPPAPGTPGPATLTVQPQLLLQSVDEQGAPLAGAGAGPGASNAYVVLVVENIDAMAAYEDGAIYTLTLK